MSSVFIVAGSRLLRETLARLLNKRGGVSVCGVSPCVPDTTSTVAVSGADVLILDSVITRLAGCAFISEIVEEVPNMCVMAIDMDDDPESFLECIRAGAVAYLLKDASAAQVVAGVQSVLRGEAVCPPHLSRHLFKAFARQYTFFPSARIKLQFGLTRRQQQLIPLLSQGLTNKEIASDLRIAEQTVKNHVHRIMRRVGAKDRLEVIDLTSKI